MTTAYFPPLVQLAQVGGELSSIQNDLQNASTTLALQDVVKRLFNVVSLHLYHTIHDTAGRMNDMGAAQPQAPAAPVRAVAPVQQAPALSPQSSMHSNFGLPGLPNRPPIISQPGLAPPASSGGMPGIAPSDVANVVITPQGTQVIPPAGAGAPITLPPNTAVDLARMSGRPELPPAPPGVAQVVVPQGGAVTPELAAALAAR
jgi:hypothetical protein